MKSRKRHALPVLPPMQCDKGCGECCGVVPVTKAELAAVRTYVADHGITPQAQGTRCPLGLLPTLTVRGNHNRSRPRRQVGRWPCDSDRIWTAEPDVARVVFGLPGRVDRERALGNTVVPQCAEVVGQVINQLRKGAS